MIAPRLSIALQEGYLAFPEVGDIAVLHPPADADLSALPKSQLVIIQPDFVANEAFARRGYRTEVEVGQGYAAAILCLTRAKALARSLVACACFATEGLVVIDGQKTDGVDSMLKAVRARTDIDGPISKAHGKMFWFASGDQFDDWTQGPALTAGGFWTAPGVFSADAVDPASAMLADMLPQTLSGHVADLGAGWGALSAHVLTRPDVQDAYLVETSHMALECARRNVTDQRARYHWADATQWAAPQPMDWVVMNPPFHAGRAADPDIGRSFIISAARVLAPRGQLLMVANRHLPYETTLSERFAKVEEVGGDGRFKVLHATRPIRKRTKNG